MSVILTTWSALKTLSASKAIAMQYVEEDRIYRVFVPDSPIIFSTEILIGTDDATDFETNYKAKTNTPNAILPSPYASKIYGTKKLYARNTGKQFTLTTGSNDLVYTATYPWVKFSAMECIGGEALDYGELKVYDSASGTYSGVANALLNQFGYTLNIGPEFYKRESQFDADLYAGMVLKITYNSISDKTIGINYIMNEVK
jgi:hypothetical protein